MTASIATINKIKKSTKQAKKNSSGKASMIGSFMGSKTQSLFLNKTYERSQKTAEKKYSSAPAKKSFLSK
jgi:hypothetical protein